MLVNLDNYTTLCNPFRYLIGADHVQGTPNAVYEAPYDQTEANGAIIKYGNLRDEKNSQVFGPYLESDDIDEQYDEPAPDPTMAGYGRNWRQQLTRCVGKFPVIEPDNQDTYSIADVRQAFDMAAALNLFVVAKNPQSFDEPTPIIAHPACVGVIVEKSSVSPGQLDKLRVDSGKPLLWIAFVAFGDGEAWAERVAKQAMGKTNMGVTYYEGEDEYTGPVRDLLLPVPGFLPL